MSTPEEKYKAQLAAAQNRVNNGKVVVGKGENTIPPHTEGTEKKTGAHYGGGVRSNKKSSTQQKSRRNKRRGARKTRGRKQKK